MGEEFRGLSDQALRDLFNESDEILGRMQRQLATLNRQHSTTLERRLRIADEIRRRSNVAVA